MKNFLCLVLISYMPLMHYANNKALPYPVAYDAGIIHKFTYNHNGVGYPDFNNQQLTREQLTIRWLAKTLTRMGEANLAKRLMKDYYDVNHRVRFGIIRNALGQVIDANAATGRSNNGGNEMVINESMLSRIGDMDRILKSKPYGASSSVISDAMTVVHEYIHMDQEDPDNYPPWEDPAWQASDKTLNKWVQKIEVEYNAARNMPASKEKTAKLNEITEILKRLHSEMGATREAIDKNVANGSLSPNQHWLLDDTGKRIQAIKDATKKYDAIEKLGTGQVQTKKDPGYWQLVGGQAFDKLAPTDLNYSISASDGSLKTGWHQNADVFNITATFTSPPKQIRPTDKFPIQISVSVSNQGDQYSANGDFAIYFDKPEIEPGTIIAPISLKGDKGESGNINFTHRLGIPPSPAASLLVYIDGKNLPTGSKGARIALMAALYNGRSAGYRYMYEWKDNW